MSQKNLPASSVAFVDITTDVNLHNDRVPLDLKDTPETREKILKLNDSFFNYFEDCLLAQPVFCAKNTDGAHILLHVWAQASGNDCERLERYHSWVCGYFCECLR